MSEDIPVTGYSDEQLAALAAAATQGEWSAADEHGELGPGAEPAWCVSRMNVKSYLYDIAYTAGTNEKADAEFIAAANPERVLALLARAAQAEAERDDLGHIAANYQARAVAAERALAAVRETAGEWQYGVLTEHGWVHEARGENYGIHKRWATHSTPLWNADGSPVAAPLSVSVGVAQGGLCLNCNQPMTSHDTMAHCRVGVAQDEQELANFPAGDEDNPYPACHECGGDGLCYACQGSGNFIANRPVGVAQDPPTEPGCRYDKHGHCPPGTTDCDCPGVVRDIPASPSEHDWDTWADVRTCRRCRITEHDHARFAACPGVPASPPNGEERRIPYDPDQPLCKHGWNRAHNEWTGPGQLTPVPCPGPAGDKEQQ